MILLMESPIKNQRFILSAENHPYKFFLETAATALGKPKPKIKAGRLLVGLARRLDTVKSMITGNPPLITGEIARGALNKTYYSSEKIKQALNFEFIPVAQSIKDVAGIYLKEKKNGSLT